MRSVRLGDGMKATIEAVSTVPASKGRTAPIHVALEGLWVTLGHILAALAALAGLRLLTEIAPSELFGAYVLFNGGLALAQGLLFGPGGQAVLRYYPDFAEGGWEYRLRAWAAHLFRRRWTWAAGGILTAAVADGVLFHRVGLSLWLLSLAAVAIEGWRTLEIAMRNAARLQRQYALLLASDAIARPLGAIAAATVAGASLESLVLGQTVGGAIAVSAFALRPRVLGIHGRDRSLVPRGKLERLEEHMKRFAAPLTWLPVLGWLTGLADRYIVAGLLGLAEAGVYAAAYGLASRPLLLVGTVTEATLRQPLYEAVGSRDRRSARRILMAWLGLNFAIGTAIGAGLSLGAGTLSQWLLAESYRYAATALIPWIGAGYVALICAQALERVLYSRGQTGAVVVVQAVSAGLSVIGAAIGAYLGGLRGAAAAVPVYFFLQFVLTAWVVSGCSK